MLSTLVSSLVILGSSAGFVSAAAPPPFARANLIPGPLGPISGNVLFTASGEGCTVDLLLSGFPSEGGPWPYHVHQYAVTGNNCSTAGAPFALANETNIPAPCPASDSPGGCRAGDMAGQFGNLTSSGSSMTASYYDPYISLDPTAANYVGNLSFNVHFANFTVIACANIVMGEAEYTPSASVSSASSTSSASSASSVASSASSAAASSVASAASSAAKSSTAASVTSSLPVNSGAAVTKVFGGMFVAVIAVLATALVF